MRSGQIELGLGNVHRAAGIFHAYLRAFRDGRHWEEASYWAARTDVLRGDSAGARALVSRIRAAEPFSYYAVMGARLLGEPFAVSVPKGADPVRPAWLLEGLRRLDLLDSAGLGEGADAEVDRLRARAARSTAATLSLARALIDRGRTVEGINLGWKLRAGGHPWDLELLKVVYPFPYRTLVVREAEEWNIDPFLLAALIRQESAFDPHIVSSAGAVGLMQLMLPTAKALARQRGPAELSAKNLTSPEVNLHLGTAFLVELDRRYHGDLPLVLSAYNAGPTRASRWSRFEEVKDSPRFVERIPFAETRGYVKNVQRNLGVYQALYAPE
jgi:soluble lytic murein transglycosylase